MVFFVNAINKVNTAEVYLVNNFNIDAVQQYIDCRIVYSQLKVKALIFGIISGGIGFSMLILTLAKWNNHSYTTSKSGLDQKKTEE